jgi:hypothetical protein
MLQRQAGKAGKVNRLACRKNNNIVNRKKQYRRSGQKVLAVR